MSDNNEDDKALWAMFTKGMKKIPQMPTLPDEPLVKSRRAKSTPSSSAKNNDEGAVRGAPSSLPPTGAAAERFPGTDLDRRTEERLLSGKLPIDGRIDLHGMTQDQAQRALSFFIEESLARGRRTVLVITGKGRGGVLASETAAADWLSPKPGVLRQNMPRWLEAPGIKPHILKIVPAQPKHGGSGAFYIYLRRAR